MFSPIYMGQRQLSLYSNLLRAEQPVDQTPMGTRLSAPKQTSLGSTQPPVKWVLCFFPSGKVAGAWR